MATLSVGGTTVFDGATLQSGAVLTSATFPAGHVLQVLIDEDATQQTFASTTYTSTDLSIAITPSSTSSKILCQWSMEAIIGNGEGYGVQLYSSKDGAVYTSGTWYDIYNSAGGSMRLRGWWAYLDSPSTNTAVTYSIKVASHDSMSISLNSASNQTQLIVMEIAG
jgi:hypothetical protein